MIIIHHLGTMNIYIRLMCFDWRSESFTEEVKRDYKGLYGMFCKSRDSKTKNMHLSFLK